MERFNRTLCESLAKLTQGEKDWDDFISPMLFGYRTSKQASTKFTPFYLVHGRTPQMPHMEMDEIIKGNILDCLYQLTEKLPNVQGKAQENIRKAQRKQKERFDLKVTRKRKFKIGDKVLSYDAARDKHFTGKLKPKWKGPYYIYDDLGNEAFKLRTMEGKLLAAPQNHYQLKPYFDCEKWEPTIVFEN